MKATGSVRKIDELGRLVVPKDLRKMLKLNEGDQVEIFVNRKSPEIILKKYSPLVEMTDLLDGFAKAIHDAINKPVFITNTEKALVKAGASRPLFTLSDHASQTIIKARQPLFTKEPIEEDSLEGYFCPIVFESESLGAVIIESKKADLSETDKMLGETTASIIRRYFET